MASDKRSLVLQRSDSNRIEQPNKGLQRTARCADKIVAILKARISSTAFSVYGCAAAEAQAVSWQPSISRSDKAVIKMIQFCTEPHRSSHPTADLHHVRCEDAYTTRNLQAD